MNVAGLLRGISRTRAAGHHEEDQGAGRRGYGGGRVCAVWVLCWLLPILDPVFAELPAPLQALGTNCRLSLESTLEEAGIDHNISIWNDALRFSGVNFLLTDRTTLFIPTDESLVDCPDGDAACSLGQGMAWRSFLTRPEGIGDLLFHISTDTSGPILPNSGSWAQQPAARQTLLTPISGSTNGTLPWAVQVYWSGDRADPYKVFYASDGAQPTSYNATQGATYLDTYSFCNSSTLVVLDRPIPAPPIPPTNLSSVEGLESLCWTNAMRVLLPSSSAPLTEAWEDVAAVALELGAEEALRMRMSAALDTSSRATFFVPGTDVLEGLPQAAGLNASFLEGTLGVLLSSLTPGGHCPAWFTSNSTENQTLALPGLDMGLAAETRVQRPGDGEEILLTRPSSGMSVGANLTGTACFSTIYATDGLLDTTSPPLEALPLNDSDWRMLLAGEGDKESMFGVQGNCNPGQDAVQQVQLGGTGTSAPADASPDAAGPPPSPTGDDGGGGGGASTAAIVALAVVLPLAALGALGGALLLLRRRRRRRAAAAAAAAAKPGSLDGGDGGTGRSSSLHTTGTSPLDGAPLGPGRSMVMVRDWPPRESSREGSGATRGPGPAAPGSASVDAAAGAGMDPDGDEDAAHDADFLLSTQELVWVVDPATGRPPFLGSGTFSTVYRAALGSGEAVAVKCLSVLPDAEGGNHVPLDVVRREAAVLRSCRSRYVVNFQGVVLPTALAAAAGTGREPPVPRGSLLVVTELVQGGDLYSALRAGRMRWYDGGARVAHDVAAGLAYLHSRRIIHFDLKSRNTLLTERGRAKLGDVGQARMLPFARSFLSSELHVGTWSHAAPETILGQRCTVQSDIYSYGVLLWEIVTGSVPIRNEMREVRVPEECPLDIAELIKACWRSDPAARPTASELLERLVAYAEPAGDPP
ncbi:hypothetical protein ACKKBG_A38395 [Auxenochlorella protothecoides x Auxenochlorella symbiontica]